MPKLKQFCFAYVCLFLLALFAGCAKQEVTKKDEGIAPRPLTKQVESQNVTGPPKTAETATELKASHTPVPAPSSVQQAQKSSTNITLQSALERIYFDFDSAVLSKSARDALTKNADVLKQATAKVRIEGNCDERGSAEYNLALGERRAKAAQQYLLTLGVAPSRMTTISYGKEKPAVKGSDEAAMAKNRRDEFVVIE